MTSIHPGYVNTEISKNAKTADNKSFGKKDAAIAQGEDPKEWVKKAVKSIYFKDSEAIITNKRFHHFAIYMRNIWPGLVFYGSAGYKKTQIKNMQNSQ